jgi:hypothetical protein
MRRFGLRASAPLFAAALLFATACAIALFFLALAAVLAALAALPALLAGLTTLLLLLVTLLVRHV